MLCGTFVTRTKSGDDGSARHHLRLSSKDILKGSKKSQRLSSVAFFVFPMQRIYLRHIEEVISSDNKSRAFLDYLKIRIASKNRCGGFNLSQLIDSLNTSETSSRKSLKRLIKYNYVTQVKKNLYKINSFKSLVGLNLHEKFFKISEEQISSYSWKNISHFRALLVELRVQQNRNIRKSLRRGYTVIDRHGVKTKIKSQSEKEFDTLMGSNYVSTFTNKHFTTILKYRKKQTLVKYSIEKPILVKTESNAEDTYTGIKEHKYKDKYGKYFINRNNLIFVGIATRTGGIQINGY